MHNNLREKINQIREEVDSHLREINVSEFNKLKRDKDKLIEYVKEKDTSVDIVFSDILGFPKKFTIKPSELEGAFNQGMGFDGSSVQGFARINESDMVAFPLIETAQIIPFKVGGSTTIRMFAEIKKTDGSSYECDPRNILIKNLEKLNKFNITRMNVGPEAEFFYFKNTEEPIPLDSAGYFDLVPRDAGIDLREISSFILEKMGIQVEYHHHEVAPSQHEIDLKYTDALTMADNLMTFKWVIKEIASRVGIHATFMPKPIAGENGSGMHIHFSYWNENKNIMFNENSGDHLSETAKQIIGGLKYNIREITLVLNQWFNSYGRLVPGCEAPVYIGWARRNRSALIRVPEYRSGKEEATRIELRSPDAGCSPHLAFAAIIGASIDGIENNRDVGTELTFDLYDETERQKAIEKGIKINSLPQNLHEAITEAKNSELLKGIIGIETHRKLIGVKKEEVKNFRLHVSKKELRDYLKL